LGNFLINTKVLISIRPVVTGDTASQSEDHYYY